MMQPDGGLAVLGGGNGAVECSFVGGGGGGDGGV